MTMLGRLTDWQVGEFIDLLIADGAENWAGLHFSEPSGAHPEATEIPGGTYTRQKAIFERVGARAIRTTNQQAWGALAETVVTHFGIWTAPYAGQLRAYVTLVNPIYVLPGGAYVLGAGELYYRWP
jgi:hypothetical protein